MKQSYTFIGAMLLLGPLLYGCGDDNTQPKAKVPTKQVSAKQVSAKAVPIIVDMPAMLGKRYRTMRRSLSQFQRTETEVIPDYEASPLYQGGKDYIYRIGPPKSKGDLPQELDVTVSSNGYITRLTASNLEGIGDTLQQSDKALARFGLWGVGEPDQNAPEGKSWANWHNMALHIGSGVDTDKVWQVQAGFAGH